MPVSPYSIKSTKYSIWSINNFVTVTTGTVPITILDESVFALTNNSTKHHNPPIWRKFIMNWIKTVGYENARREYLFDIFNKLIIQRKILSKPNRNNESYRDIENKLTSILINWKILTSQQVACLLPRLILNSNLLLISWVHQEILSIPYQRITSNI